MASKLFRAVTRNPAERTPSGPTTILPGSLLDISIGRVGEPSEGRTINPSTLAVWELRGWIRNASAIKGQRRYILTQAGYSAA